MTTPARSQSPVAVVTGGNRGVGLEVCRQLAMAGYAVVLGSRDLRKAELAAKEIDPAGTFTRDSRALPWLCGPQHPAS